MNTMKRYDPIEYHTNGCGWSWGSDSVMRECEDGGWVRREDAERENARLRSIFPKILEALQSGACAPDCSIEFLEMIPNEVAGVMRKLRLPNAGSEPPRSNT